MKLRLPKTERKYGFSRVRKTQNGDFRKDSGDLVQAIIIIAAMVVASIVVVGGISSVTQSKGKSTAECINNSTGFGQGAVARDNCKKTDEEAQEKGEEEIGGNFGESSPIGGSEPEEEEELITPTSDTCFVLNTQGDTIIDYKDELEECTTDVVIPSSINNITIIGIGTRAFYNKKLTSVSIPNSITTIYDRSFTQNQLDNVRIPDSVTSIGDYAFYNNQLTSVSISNSITAINQYVFGNNKLTNVSIPNDVTNIGGSAFANNQLTNVSIPNSVTIIGIHAFRYNQLASVNIPDSVTGIYGYAFNDNQLTSVVIPDSVTVIGIEAFRNNPLTSASIPSSLRLGLGHTGFPTTTNITIRS